MRHPVRLTVLAVIAALALPAMAAAHERPSTTTVRQHAKVADRALSKTAAQVRLGRDATAARTLGTHRRHLRAARREATRLRRAARRGGSVRRAVTADAAVANVAGDCVETLSAVVAQAGGPAQLDIAQAIEACAAIRQAVIDALNQLLPVVPEQVRPIIAKLIADLSTAAPGDATAIGSALGTPGLPPAVMTTLTSAFQIVTQTINMVTEQLAAIVPLLPPIAQPIVQSALEMVTQLTTQVISMVEDLLGQIFGMTAPGTGTPSSGFSIPGLGFLDGILGWLFGT